MTFCSGGSRPHCNLLHSPFHTSLFSITLHHLSHFGGVVVRQYGLAWSETWVDEFVGIDRREPLLYKRAECETASAGLVLRSYPNTIWSFQRFIPASPV